MNMPAAQVERSLKVHARTLAWVIVLLLALNAIVAARHGSPGTEERGLGLAGDTTGASSAAATDLGGDAAGPGIFAQAPLAGSEAGRTGPGGTASTASGGGAGGGPGVKGTGPGRLPQGVTGAEISVVYYWKGDRTMTSPYLRGSGQEGNVDEAEAFRTLIAYLNKHGAGGRTFMGLPFNLHGRKLKPVVLEAGQYPDTYAATAEKIVKEIRPFAAVSSHGSLSAYICPRLSNAGIFNPSTYDLDWGLYAESGGQCLPQGMSWGAQVDLSVAYLAKQSRTTTYQGTAGPEPRRYGFLYAEYPGLVDSAPKVVTMLRKAGVPVVEVASIAADLTTGQQMAPNIVAKFRAKGVNTVVMPDAGAPLNFTHASQASGYNPDYYIWPCSGQDTTGMVRLFNAGQWARASGLTCYDYEYDSDLTNDDKARRTEWYRIYQEMKPGAEPPAPTSIVYRALVPLVAGITNAGRALTVESFRAGLGAFDPYRYDTIKGRTTNPTDMLVTLDPRDGSQLGDAAKVRWDASKREPGAAAPGAYVYPEKRRYARGSSF